jgi:hypothetical protein
MKGSLIVTWTILPAQKVKPLESMSQLSVDTLYMHPQHWYCIGAPPKLTRHIHIHIIFCSM